MLIAFFLISILCSSISIPSSLFAAEARNFGAYNSLNEQKRTSESAPSSANKSKITNLNRMQNALLDNLEQKVLESLKNAGWPLTQSKISSGNHKQNGKVKRSMQPTGQLWTFGCGENCLDGDEYNFSEDELKDDIIMQFTTDQDLARILLWTAKQLEALRNFNTSGDLKFLNNLNLSGRREGPLYVEEPHYVIVRREEPYPPNMGLYRYTNDPFIPPRGRKHMPSLDDLLRRHDLFVPNRGKKDHIKKKDKIKDIFKYEDLFYPNRGKKQIKPMIDSRPPSVKAMKLSSNCFTLFNDINNGGGRGGGCGGIESGSDGRIHDINHKETDDDGSRLRWNHDVATDVIDDDQTDFNFKMIPTRGFVNEIMSKNAEVKSKDRFVKSENLQPFDGSSASKLNFVGGGGGGDSFGTFDVPMPIQQRVQPFDSILSRLRQQQNRNEQFVDYNYVDV